MIRMFEKGDYVERMLMFLNENGEGLTMGYFIGIVADDKPSENPRFLKHLIWLSKNGADYKAELVDMDEDWVSKFNLAKDNQVKLCDTNPLFSDRITDYLDCLAKKGIDLLAE